MGVNLEQFNIDIKKDKDLLNKVTHIANYYQTHEEAIPSLYEFIEVTSEVINYMVGTAPKDAFKYKALKDNRKIVDITGKESDEKYKIVDQIDKEYQIISTEVGMHLLDQGLVEDISSPIYRLFQEAIYLEQAQIVMPENDLDLMKKAGEVNLYIAKQKQLVKDGVISSFCYDNSQEFFEINQLASKPHIYNNDIMDQIVKDISHDFEKTYTISDFVKDSSTQK